MIGSLVRSLLGHALGYSSPTQTGALFMRVTGIFALAALSIGGLFALYGWSASDPVMHLGRLLVGGLLAFVFVAGVWFVFGAGLTLVRHRGASQNSDGLIVMILISVTALGWSGRGLSLLSRGAPVTEAIAWSGVQPWGAVRVNGDVIVARGTIRTSFAQAIDEALSATPNARELRIESGGGSVSLAAALARRVRARGLDVRTDRYCASACLQIFLAGERRILHRRAALGCHQRSDAVTGQPAGPSRSFRDVSPPAEAADTFRAIIARCDATPPEAIFEPALSDLIAITAVTHIATETGVQDAQAFAAAAGFRS